MDNLILLFVLWIRLPPRYTRTDTRFPYTTLFRSVQLVRVREQAVLEQAVEREVRLGLRFVEVIFRLAQLFGVIGPVPGRELVAGVFGIGQFLHLGQLAPGVGDRRRRQLGEHLVGRVRRFRCLVFQYIGGMRSEEHTYELQSLMRLSYAVFCL